jgi:hypothetical protein
MPLKSIAELSIERQTSYLLFFSQNLGIQTSNPLISLTSPEAIPSIVIFPNRNRTNLKVGNPIFAVIRLTCLFLPSVKVIDIQVSGIEALNRIGGTLSGKLGTVGKTLAFAG